MGILGNTQIATPFLKLSPRASTALAASWGSASGAIIGWRWRPKRWAPLEGAATHLALVGEDPGMIR
jgi:hypothetical protein